MQEDDSVSTKSDGIDALGAKIMKMKRQEPYMGETIYQEQEDDSVSTKSDSIDALRAKIMEVLRQEPYMGEKIPTRWCLLFLPQSFEAPGCRSWASYV